MVGYNQTLQIFHVFLQVIDLRNSQMDKKADWLGFNSSSSERKLYVLLKIIFSKIFPKMGKREIGRWFLTNCLSLFLCTGYNIRPFR